MSKITSFAKKQSRILMGITVGLLVGGAGTTAVLASVPDTNGAIHACYKSDGLDAGQVRIIDSPGDSCTEDETAVSWNSASPGQYVTNLVNADFTGSDLRYRNFTGQDLHGANLTQTNLAGANFDRANLSGVLFDNGTKLANNASFRNANLSNAIFTGGAYLQSNDFSNATFAGVTFNIDTAMIYSNFTGVDFTSAHFQTTGGTAPLLGSSNLTDTDFTGVNLSNMDFSNNVTNGANFTNANFTGTNLYSTTLSNTNLTGAIWSHTACPDNVNSDDNGGTCDGHLVF